MDDLVKSAIENGKNANEILEMPFQYVVELLREKNAPEKSNSFFDLL